MKVLEVNPMNIDLDLPETPGFKPHKDIFVAVYSELDPPAGLIKDELYEN